MYTQQSKYKEACQQLLDLLIDDNKVKNEILKETTELKQIEVTKRVQFVLRSIYSHRFLNLVIKKHQSAAAEQALINYLEEKEGFVRKRPATGTDGNLARKETKSSSQ